MVCLHCARWNLSPLDERWEVIESLERIYRDTPKRLSTDQVGLAKLKDGTTLVRIGEPVFPEYASWRYGRLFTKRERSATYGAGAGAGAVIASLLLLGGPVAVVSGAGVTGFLAYQAARLGIRGVTGLRRLGEIPLLDGRTEMLTVSRARRARIVATSDGGWTLALPEFGGKLLRETVADEVTEEEQRDGVGLWQRQQLFDLVDPAQAEMVARRVMPVVNHAGGDDDMVRGASKLHEQWEGKIGDTVAKLVDFRKRPMALVGEPYLSLAFEMSVYEEQEQRWLQSELYLLKGAWKEAERLAAIADSLTLPEWLEARMVAMRGDDGQVKG